MMRIRAQKNGQRCNTGRADAPRSFSLQRRMRRQTSPHNLPSQAEAIEQLRVVRGNAARQDRGFPSRRGDLIALQLPQYLIQTVDAVQLSSRRDMLPAAQKPHESGGSDRFNFLAQTPYGQPMD